MDRILGHVPLLRRTPPVTEEPAAPETDAADPRQQGKGRPTPKRRDAQKNRRTAVPRDRKQAEQLRRERMREQRKLTRQALLTGDERHLPARDQGPARRLARDMVDSRFTLGQFALVGIVVLFVLQTVAAKYTVVALITQFALLLAAIAVGAQAWVIGTSVQKRVTQQYGADEARGIRTYAMMRVLSARRMRRPPPRVKRGDTV